MISHWQIRSVPLGEQPRFVLRHKIGIELSGPQFSPETPDQHAFYIWSSFFTQKEIIRTTFPGAFFDPQEPNYVFFSDPDYALIKLAAS